MDKRAKTVDLFFSYEQGKELAAAQAGVEVLEQSVDEKGIHLKIRGSPHRINQILISSGK
jgi:hypothetical protein